MNILVCSLGASWAVVPEVLGFIAPQLLPLYLNHPEADELSAHAKAYGLQASHELWVLTTAGQQTRLSLDRLQAWWAALGRPLPLRIWIAACTDQLATPDECKRIRELTLRVVLHARERAAGGQVVLSLAGGRKTMSADLQMAGSLLGAHAWLHVVGPDPLPAELARDPSPELFTRPLPQHLAGAVRPLVVGLGRSDDLLDVPLAGQRIEPKLYPLTISDAPLQWQLGADQPWLTDEIECRQREGAQLLHNFFSSITRSDTVPTWPGLLRLSPRVIEMLRATRLGAEHRDFLQKLPKVDLHRHLGGCLDLAAQRRVAQAIWDGMTEHARVRATSAVSALIASEAPWTWDWPEQLRGPHRAQNTAALLLHATDRQLYAALYEATEPRVALKSRHARGFAAYERPGDLSGSALLCDEAAWDAYAREVVAAAKAEGLAALELRGSPHKYAPNVSIGFVRRLRQALAAAGALVDEMPAGQALGAPRIGFIWILDRRNSTDAAQIIGNAVQARREMPNFVLGLDLAGDERCSRPKEWAPHFETAFQECLFVTVHAGEDESAENIWEAAYRLHADRIGHGLSLHENRRLLTRFRDRGVCLELCPTSNIEVVGFYDPAREATLGLPTYPLRILLDEGLPLTLCTDNPAISRTTLAEEYIVASRITSDGLSIWEALGLIRQAFEHSFFPAQDRRALLNAADSVVVEAVVDAFVSGAV